MKFLSLAFVFCLFSTTTVQAAEGAACLFNNTVVPDTTTIVAYQNSTVPYGQTCVSEIRLCDNGTLVGSYTFDSCTVDGPAACLFNGQTVASGQTVTAYQNSSVPYGQACSSQTLTCTNGAFDGTYTYASCTVGAPAACLFNGQTIASGQTITAYQNSTVPYGQTCVSQVETCTNGSFDGSLQFASCSVDAPASCLFNGQTVVSGQTVTAFPTSTVPYGQSCLPQTELCTNGVLSGNDAFSSCTVDAPAACLFNGTTVASGQTIVAYPASSVPYGQSCLGQNETCTNGVFNGTASFPSCTVGAPAACQFLGQTVADGQTVVTYPLPTVPYGQTCTPVTETCSNGTLSGSNAYGSCTVGAPAACTFNGQSVPSSHAVTAYQNSSVPFGQTCQAQQRNCVNGALDGSYAYSTCTVLPQPPPPPPPPPPPQPQTCSFDGEILKEGQSVIAYKYSRAHGDDERSHEKRFSHSDDRRRHDRDEGDDEDDEGKHHSRCEDNSQVRTCHKGQLSGTYQYRHCEECDEEFERHRHHHDDEDRDDHREKRDEDHH